jgi:nicotinamide riboside transporter PnuC
MSPFTTTLLEWGATLLSVVGFWLCIQHRASCFVVFLVADLGWFLSAWMNFHPTLLAQQSVYIVLNIVGFVLWRKDDQLKAKLNQIERRDLQTSDSKKGPTKTFEHTEVLSSKI